MPEDWLIYRPTELRWPESNHGEHSFVFPSAVTLDMVLHPEFWGRVAPRLKLGDKLEVYTEDFSLDVVLRVVSLDPAPASLRSWAAVMVRGDTQTRPTSMLSTGVDADGYRIEEDPVQKWRIWRGNDLLDKHLPSKEAAEKRLAALKGQAARRAA